MRRRGLQSDQVDKNYDHHKIHSHISVRRFRAVGRPTIQPSTPQSFMLLLWPQPAAPAAVQVVCVRWRVVVNCWFIGIDNWFRWRQPKPQKSANLCGKGTVSPVCWEVSAVFRLFSPFRRSLGSGFKRLAEFYLLDLILTFGLRMRHYKRVREIYATGENLLIPGPECRVERSLLKPHRAVAPRRTATEQIKAGWLHYVTCHCAAVVTSSSEQKFISQVEHVLLLPTTYCLLPSGSPVS